MAQDKPRPPGLKRRLCDVITDEANERPSKRISPFHNTPIQKKETKRRILKISLRKMKSIDCPETFLRRSVLVNNLARSLQDDLKDDKLWERWGWECDLDRAPVTTSPPPPHHRYEPPASCTLLTNTTGQWTVSQQPWLSGDDDAHLSASERERVTRDLAQSHDRLAQTVERLTAFGDPKPDLYARGDKLAAMKDCVHSVPAATPVTFSGAMPEPPSHLHTQHCTNVTSSKAQQCTSRSHSPTLTSVQPTSCPSHRPPTATQSTAYGLCDIKPSYCVDSKPSSDTWTILQPAQSTNCLYSRSLSSTAQSSYSVSHSGPYDMDHTPYAEAGPVAGTSLNSLTTQVLEPSADEAIIDSNGNQCAASNKDYTGYKRQFTVPPCHTMTPDMTFSDLWATDLDPPGLTPPTQVTCSAEVDRYSEEFSAATTQNDQEKFTSQAIRDFDVIYNNLVSVLIGGN